MIQTETLNDWGEVWAALMAKSIVDASLVLAIEGVVWLAFRRRMSPQLGYCLFLLVPAKLLIPIEIPVPGWVAYGSPGHTAERIVACTTAPPVGQVAADLPRRGADLPRPPDREAVYLEGSAKTPSSDVAAVLSDVALEPSTIVDEPLAVLSTRAKLMIVWSATVLGMMTCFLHAQWRFRRILGATEPVDPDTLPLDLGHLKRLAGVKRPIRLLAGPMVSTPAVHGLLRPSLLLPLDFVDSTSPAQMRFVLLHELAHVARGDLRIAALQRLVQIVYFFNPAVWIANRLIDRQREYACDDVALAAGGVSRRESGEAFLRIVERANSCRPSLDAALGVFTPKHFFRRRLMRILDTDRRIRPKLTLGSAVLLVAIATILLPHVRAIEERIDDNGPAVARADASTDAEETEKQPTGDDPSEADGLLVSASGRVVDTEGKPMPGVTVHLRDWPTERINVGPWSRKQDVLATTETDEQGGFRFENVRVPAFLPRGLSDVPCDVVAVAKGYALAWEHLRGTTNREPIVLTLVSESGVSGRIVDGQGRPIEGALVEAVVVAPLGVDRIAGNLMGHLSLYLSQLAPTAKSDRDGRVMIGGLPTDRWVVMAVDHDDYKSEYVHVATADTPQAEVRYSTRFRPVASPQELHSNSFTLTMGPRGPQLGGRITLADSGKPHAHATVRLHGTGIWLTEKTDENGRYLFKDTLEGECRITVFGPEDTDYLPRQLPLTIPKDGPDMQLDLELPIGQIVTGSVVDEDTDEGISGVLVASAPRWGKEPNGYLGRRGLTDDQGDFRVAVLPGKSVLQIHGSVDGYDIVQGGRPGELRDARFVRMIEVGIGQPGANVRFWLSRGLGIKGLVTDADGQPVDGATVKTVRRAAEDPFQKKVTQTDEDGRFTLSGFPAESRQYLDVTHEGRSLYGKITVDADRNALSPRIVSVEAELTAAAAVKGQVLVDGKPGDGIHVDLVRNIAGRRGRSDAILATAVPDASGRYAFRVAPPSDKLRVVARGDVRSQFTEWESEEFVLEPAQIFEPPILTVRQKDTSVSGIVVGPYGEPIEAVRVSALPRDGKDKTAAATKTPTGADGRFTIRAVPNGPLKLQATKRNPSSRSGRASWFRADVEANGGDEDVRIVFPGYSDSL